MKRHDKTSLQNHRPLERQEGSTAGEVARSAENPIARAKESSLQASSTQSSLHQRAIDPAMKGEEVVIKDVDTEDTQVYEHTLSGQPVEIIGKIATHVLHTTCGLQALKTMRRLSKKTKRTSDTALQQILAQNGETLQTYLKSVTWKEILEFVRLIQTTKTNCPDDTKDTIRTIIQKKVPEELSKKYISYTWGKSVVYRPEYSFLVTPQIIIEADHNERLRICTFLGNSIYYLIGDLNGEHITELTQAINPKMITEANHKERRNICFFLQMGLSYFYNDLDSEHIAKLTQAITPQMIADADHNERQRICDFLFKSIFYLHHNLDSEHIAKLTQAITPQMIADAEHDERRRICNFLEESLFYFYSDLDSEHLVKLTQAITPQMIADID